MPAVVGVVMVVDAPVLVRMEVAVAMKGT